MKMFKWLAGACVLAVSGLTYAQADYPNKPVKLVVGYATGGPTDVIARLVAQDMAAALGQAVVIENRVGANGNIDRKSTRLNSSHT